MIQPICQKYLAGSIAAVVAAFSLVNGVHAQCPLMFEIDCFDDGDDVGWTHYDFLEGYGPGVYACTSGEYCLASPQVILADDSVWLASLWNQSEDPSYSEGFLRVRLRAVTQNTRVFLGMRAGDAAAEEGYIFMASPVDGRFSMFCSPSCSGVQYVDGVAEFLLNEDWFMQAGVVGDQMSIKVWKVGDLEPAVPQVTITDITYATGNLGVAAQHWPGIASKIMGVFDDICFKFPGDFDGDGYVGPEDCAGFVNCMTGPGPADPPTGCNFGQFDLADSDDDSDVDLSDFADFQSVFEGER